MKYLKIKDNVDLKELEKFGYFKSSDNKYVKIGVFASENVIIWIENNKTFFIEWGWYIMRGMEQERFLKDLIKADLVEVVENDN